MCSYQIILAIHAARKIAGILVLPSNFAGEVHNAAFAELFESKASSELREAVAEGRAITHYVFLHNATADPAQAKERFDFNIVS